MAPRRTDRAPSLLVRRDQPLIGVFVQEEGRDVVRYFVEDDAADAALGRDVTRQALDTIGAWQDLGWEDIEQALDRIRHQSEPTPPLEV